MMAAILNSAMLDSDTAIMDSAILHKTLTQTNPIWFKLIQSDSTLMMSVILNSAFF